MVTEGVAVMVLERAPQNLSSDGLSRAHEAWVGSMQSGSAVALGWAMLGPFFWLSAAHTGQLDFSAVSALASPPSGSGMRDKGTLSLVALTGILGTTLAVRHVNWNQYYNKGPLLVPFSPPTRAITSLPRAHGAGQCWALIGGEHSTSQPIMELSALYLGHVLQSAANHWKPESLRRHCSQPLESVILGWVCFGVVQITSVFLLVV